MDAREDPPKTMEDTRSTLKPWSERHVAAKARHNSVQCVASTSGTRSIASFSASSFISIINGSKDPSYRYELAGGRRMNISIVPLRGAPFTLDVEPLDTIHIVKQIFVRLKAKF